MVARPPHGLPRHLVRPQLHHAVLGVRPELARPQLGLHGVAVAPHGTLDQVGLGAAAATALLRGLWQRGGACMA
jgi:hypothetical protein